jgi:hypothetical protein
MEAAAASMEEARTAEAGDSSNEVIETMKREMTDMTNVRLRAPSACARSAMIPFTLLTMWAIGGAYPGLAQQPAQQTFSSAAEASQSLLQAVQSNNEEAIVNILGGPTDLTSSRDPGQDKLDRELFAEKYQEMHRLHRETDGSVTLYIGAENWPFPIPLVQKNGAWRFDADSGLKEVLFRRIGENELTAIATCRDSLAATKHDGAKPNGANPVESVPAGLVARGSGESAGTDPVLFHGYYFRELPTQSTNATRRGLAVIAYPAEYRSSGVMTFIVTDKGVVYEKDLGTNTTATATTMTAFHKDATWRTADK